MRLIKTVFLTLVLAFAAAAQWNALNPVTGVVQQPDGLLLRLQTGSLRLQVCSDSIIHVLYSPTSSFPKIKDYVVIKNTWPATRWTTESNAEEVRLATAK